MQKITTTASSRHTDNRVITIVAVNVLLGLVGSK